MLCRLGFFRTYDYRLLVAAELSTDIASGGRAAIRTTRFDDEADFLQAVVEAEYDPDTATSLLANALLALSSRSDRCQWTQVTYSDKQFATLGLLGFLGKLERRRASDKEDPTEAHLRDVLMQAPVPLAMLRGPEHVFTLVNPAYVRLANRVSAESLLGRTVKQALPELEEQRFVALLDKVYATGKPYYGQEMPIKLRDEATGEWQDNYYDFVYFPLKNDAAEVFGIMFQGTLVTESVLNRHVIEARESKMFRQWAELEAIYRKSPVAMALVDAEEYRFLRVNEASAKLIGLSEEELLGERIFDLFPHWTRLKGLYEQVCRGEEVRNVRFDRAGTEGNGGVRRMIFTLSPVRDTSGRIEAIASVAVDVNPSDLSEADAVVHAGPKEKTN